MFNNELIIQWLKHEMPEYVFVDNINIDTKKVISQKSTPPKNELKKENIKKPKKESFKQNIKQSNNWKNIVPEKKSDFWSKDKKGSYLTDCLLMVHEDCKMEEKKIIQIAYSCLTKANISCDIISFGEKRGFFLPNCKSIITSEKNSDMMPSGHNIMYVKWDLFSTSKPYRAQIWSMIQTSVCKPNMQM